MPDTKNTAPDALAGENDSERRPSNCSVCRGTRMCSFCTGDGYLMEKGDIHPCGVCGGTGCCQLCAAH